jgi:hypothetical protein
MTSPLGIRVKGYSAPISPILLPKYIVFEQAYNCIGKKHKVK